MNKVWAVACILVGVLFGCLGGFFFLVWFASIIDGVEWGGLVAAVVCVCASIISFLVARRLWRIDEE
jgi:lipopolysaccharide export LptBFGC system permease protein LptF